ncbi:nephrin-like isoform X4 [Symsagittifera roscoffensis]|uniref:nephrin-like isoform X4 n=1 Tax=Symsagittifera roscoffensis TaxID=84072 RepID=UPI00307C83E8
MLVVMKVLHLQLVLILIARGGFVIAQGSSFYVEQPRDLTIFENENAVFECRIPEDYSACLFEYRGVYLLSSRQNSSEYEMYSTNGYCSLTVLSAPGDHNGAEFSCIVATTNGGSEDSRKVTLKVLIPPKSLQMTVSMNSKDQATVLPSGEIQAVAGQVVQFSCQVVGARPAVDIQWYLDGGVLPSEFFNQHQEISEREEARDCRFDSADYDEFCTKTILVYDTHSTLDLTITEQQDQSDLSCATVEQENVQNQLMQTKTLNILYPPTYVQLNSADLASPVKVGESVRVRCTCDSGNPLPELKLYQNGIELSGYKSVTSQQVLVEFDFAAERDDHSSVFKCEATSPSIPHAPVIKQELLQVYFKPAAVQISGFNREIRRNDVISLECRTGLSYPAADVSWTLNGNKVGLSQDKISGNSSHGYHTTSLYEVRIDDESISTVACEAENPQFEGVVTRDTVELQIQYPPSKPELTVEPVKMEGSYKEEDSVRLSCQSKGRPMPVISWYKDSILLDSGADPVPDIEYTSKYSFSLSHLSREDHGKTFSCEASNVVVATDQTPPTSTFTFKVHYPPLKVTITTNVEKPFLENKQGVQFTCTTDKMNPNQVIFEWFINGSPVNSEDTETNDPVTQSNGFVLSNTMRLNRPMDRQDHNLPVTCKVTPVQFPEMVVSATYHIEVYFEPRLISNIPLRVIVNESSTTNLDCGGAETNPVIAYYQWTGTKVVQTPGSKLEFLATSREDAGDYFCKACNCDVPTNHDLCPWTACSVTRQITLEVEYAPTLTTETDLLEVDIGSHATIRCKQTANPPGQVFWMFEDQVIDPYAVNLKYNISHDRFTQVSSLKVESVVQADAGRYACGVVNKLGEDQIKVQLAVKHAPYFESNENTRLVISGRDEGDISATLHCVANGYPELNFDWINYPTDQSTTKRIVQLSPSKWRSELTISPLYATSFGNYTCTAKNNMGADTWRVELSKPRVPGKPSKFVIQETSHKSQTFKWTTGFDGGWPQAFEILYQVLGRENEGWKIATVTTECKTSHSDCNYTVSSLASATTYTFKVCAHNRVGPDNREAACSEIIQATTYAAPIQPAHKSFREMPFWLMIALPTLTGLFIVTNLIFLALYCRKRFFNKNKGDERPFSISTQSSSRADHAGMLYQDSGYYFPAGGSDRWPPGGGSDIGDKDSRYFGNYPHGSPPQMNRIDLFERSAAASTHSDDVTTRMHGVSSEFDPACRVNPGLAAAAGHPLYLTGPPVHHRGSAQWPNGGIGVRTSQFDSPPVQAMSNNNEESYKNQIRQKSRQGNCRTGESYFSGESRSSTPVQHHHVQAPLLMPPTNPLSMSQHSQEQSLLNRYDSLAETHHESVSDCTNLESGRGSGCNLTVNSNSNNQEHQSSLYSKKL